MKQVAFLFLLLTSIFACSLISKGQTVPVNLDNLSEEQIGKIRSEIEARGLSPEQAAAMAKANGASQSQLDQLAKRLKAQNTAPSHLLLESNVAEPRQPVDQEMPNLDSLEVKKLTATSSLNKRIFGYHLFNQKNLTFEPSLNVSVPDSYILGAGDDLTIHVWGASQQTYILEVETNGTVNVPDLGPVQVAGFSYQEVKRILLNRLTAIYNGMIGSTPNTFADVSVGNMRAIKVNVIGEAILPGTYTLPATASAFNALYLSGGPNANGSFRNIRIIRNNKVLAIMDVYDYLINADTKNNIGLRDQDVVFIPTYNKRVEVLGAFKRNGIFELKDNENISQLLQFAGGFGEDASDSRLMITRYANDQHRLIDLEKSNFEGFELSNGDVITAERVIDRFENRVSISGAVFRPGTYALESDMRLSQLIQKAGGLREDYYSPRGLVIRLDEQLYPTTIPFDVTRLQQGEGDIQLKREDQVLIRDIFSFGEKPTLSISGEVMTPGQFDYSKNMTLKDLIFLAGGFTEAASGSYIEVARRNDHEEAATINDKMVSLFQFDVDRDLNLKQEDRSFTLKPFDHVYVRKAPSYYSQKTVSIYGEVKYPGQYSISSKTEKISDIIKRAGGLTPDAFSPGARLDRNMQSEMEQNLKLIRRLGANDSLQVDADKFGISRLELRLDEILKNPGTIRDYVLHEGDRIYVPRRSDEVWISGEVLNPVGQAWEQGRSLKYYINRAGGFSYKAQKGKAYIIYSDGTTKVTKSFFIRNYPSPKPGCQVVIPSKPERQPGDTTGKWLGIASTLSSLAVAIAAVLR